MSFVSDNTTKFEELCRNIDCLVDESARRYHNPDIVGLNNHGYVHDLCKIQSCLAGLMMRYLENIRGMRDEMFHLANSPEAIINAVSDSLVFWLILSRGTVNGWNLWLTNPFDYDIDSEWYWEEITSTNLSQHFFPLAWTEHEEDFHHLFSFGVAFLVTHYPEKYRDNIGDARQYLFDMTCLKANVRRSWIDVMQARRTGA